jgi:hypothetical protein
MSSTARENEISLIHDVEHYGARKIALGGASMDASLSHTLAPILKNYDHDDLCSALHQDQTSYESMVSSDRRHGYKILEFLIKSYYHTLWNQLPKIQAKKWESSLAGEI